MTETNRGSYDMNFNLEYVLMGHSHLASLT